MDIRKLRTSKSGKGRHIVVNDEGAALSAPRQTQLIIGVYAVLLPYVMPPPK
jgi:hypothetical protein